MKNAIYVVVYHDPDGNDFGDSCYFSSYEKAVEYRNKKEEKLAEEEGCSVEELVRWETYYNIIPIEQGE